MRSFLSNFYRHLAIFFWSHWLDVKCHNRLNMIKLRVQECEEVGGLFLFPDDSFDDCVKKILLRNFDFSSLTFFRPAAPAAAKEVVNDVKAILERNLDFLLQLNNKNKPFRRNQQFQRGFAPDNQHAFAFLYRSRHQHKDPLFTYNIFGYLLYLLQKMFITFDRRRSDLVIFFGVAAPSNPRNGCDQYQQQKSIG